MLKLRYKIRKSHSQRNGEGVGVLRGATMHEPHESPETMCDVSPVERSVGLGEKSDHQPQPNCPGCRATQGAPELALTHAPLVDKGALLWH